MLAQEAEISTVPYLWTSMFGKSLRYAGKMGTPQKGGATGLGQGAGLGGATGQWDPVKPPPLGPPTGYGEGFDDVIIQGDLEELKFVAFYTK